MYVHTIRLVAGLPCSYLVTCGILWVQDCLPPAEIARIILEVLTEK